MISLYEILVPVTINGAPIPTSFHRVWDQKVRAIANGLTILTPAKGQWLEIDGELFEEKMIPVRIACTKEQMQEIAHLTLLYYEQRAVMFYKITDQVVIYRGKS